VFLNGVIVDAFVVLVELHDKRLPMFEHPAARRF